MNQHRTVRVALLGAGSVGSQVARTLLDHADELALRVGARLELVGIAVRNVEAKRDVELPAELFTTDAKTLILGADLVVELMGGIDPARELIALALGSGADVVTANKALIATHGLELFDIAERVGAQLNYEAAVAGAIPIIRPLRDSLAGDRVDRILGIVNGTTNFILDRMHTLGGTLDEALAVATDLGYAEADPTADVEGYDAQQKAAILASIAFHTHVPVERVYREGITGVTAELIDEARTAGYVVKLLAICERITAADGATESVSARVYPALVHAQHPLASVHGGNNAIFVEAASAGSLMFYGAGAGGVETSSAVLGDVVSAARRRISGGPGLRESMHADMRVADIGDVVTRYHISLDVSDELGVLAGIARVFSDHEVSVLQIQQGDGAVPVVEALEQSTEDTPAGEQASATLVIGTHQATERSLQAVVAALESLDAVQRVKGVLRVESAA
ncbi:homoserine dehydrogenase [Pseudoclavibacter endophyticus]|uniref:Homoserine dehydrogenase n=1 Tax=Pseudoclavibacter endophyticus TaxID=1778590 RepID=A0A6H9WUL6_9MICO|nr:homoserine dehydrogenase [Pseudoclavibacter endophyticus]KAB1649880.1 homoserine dehydrogenase [Pseudoclavibacter endophyticus]GGA59049.1 homoserine dehydrogenase [Pseudoclavibacter endophyticus]